MAPELAPEMVPNSTLELAPDPAPDLAARIRHAIDTKTKPPGSLGRIEDLAAQIALLQGTLTPRMERAQLTIFAGDHGIAAEGVSAFPQAVTAQMVLNFLGGGAAANVFARTAGVALRVVDAGVAAELAHPELIVRKIAPGTANSAHGPAMTAAQCERARAAGAALGADGHADAVCFGEMGIANTAAATLVAHKITGRPVAELTGRGTGLDDGGLRRKTEVLQRAAGRTGALTPADALAEYGGFEIAMMAGAMAAAARARRLVIVDGFIASAAALVVLTEAPKLRGAMVFAHASAEAGHRAVLAHLRAEPLLSLGMRLGEGTGALLAWPLVRAAAAMLTDMASFDDAGVSRGL
ncbi:nicotinate-nucleotide--dimethylbenzimidazole phosphoribosyltransferase [Rhodobacteraceae bacterium 2CG4]|uniref:Nicotinate-nucleotide--dimethylbenzimidazole phosphoribosyltransferase n=2 Tax=Halovulum marinum TaxID=2662447 RepID=A0A6L5Z1M5_9RHOB|nr:nicotinate-nucleotide--dimethylbenzimidazole phosphoribosyltransferase [Halovulum marinum]